MDGRIDDEWMYGRKNGWMEGRKNGWIDGQKEGWVDGRIDDGWMEGRIMRQTCSGSISTLASSVG